MKRIITGIQPTGNLTLANYIGAIKQMIEIQDEYESFVFIADLHAITVPKKAQELKKDIKSLIAIYLACGIDENKNTIYLQSDIDKTTYISWLLECNTYYGELSRMTQFKDKSLKNKNFTTGLLTYPVLMSSDILSIDADIVPVGHDQKQHVELTRDIAIRFNNNYGQTFVVPEPRIPSVGAKIYDLLDPTKKMSKSAENEKGIIRLLDDKDVIIKKIMSATTDSEMNVKFDSNNKPGISNLITIYSSLSGLKIAEVEKKFEGVNYGTFKKCVAEAVVDFIVPLQARYHEILNSGRIEKILENGKNVVNPIVNKKCEELRKKIGVCL